MNKLKMIALMALVSMNMIFFSACKKNNDAKYTVTFQTNGGSTIAPVIVTSGDKLTKPTNPTKTDFTFLGWYKEASLTNEFDFTNTPITANLTLYAKWATAVITVTYNMGTTGIPAIAPKTVDKTVGSFTIVPPLAYSQNKQLLVWYTDNTYTTPFDFGHSTISADVTLYAKLQSATIPNILQAQYIPDDVVDNGTRVMLQPYLGTKVNVVPVYVTVGGTGDGTTWAKAKGSVKDAIDGITDASTTKVYLILVASGTYKAGATMSMKNNVGIIGGWATDWTRSGTTILDGNNAYQVFNNTDLNNTALLYGVSVNNGKFTSSVGGGMANHHSSPTITQVTFSDNFAGLHGGGMCNQVASSPILTQVTFLRNRTIIGKGGGMYNDNSSPLLTQVMFSDNGSNSDGGGMYNGNASAPILKQVTFSNNTTSGGNGGGMYNGSSSPILMQVTFSGNQANGGSAGIGLGGGMANIFSAPVLIQTTFYNNSAANTGEGGGGAMYNNNNGAMPMIINSIFWGNKAGTADQQISLFNDASGDTEKLSIYSTIVDGGMGTNSTASGTAGHSFGGGVGLYSAQDVVINYDKISSSNPSLFPLANNGGSIQTMAINTNSSDAVNTGLYVKRDGTNFYFSNNNSAWFSNPALTTSATPPSTAVEVTATDARGYARVGAPDLGAYEYGATAP